MVYDCYSAISEVIVFGFRNSFKRLDRPEIPELQSGLGQQLVFSENVEFYSPVAIKTPFKKLLTIS
jgi:hypothetical protein